ncbi:hypothetical protein FLAG1_10119 [Fusarium langsethiae]|uniref:HNH nuclease domain-containing protein n=1 Tax=Fusarium langsethiae TaxID=179993 RepID=A0A0M9EPQ8_FUSLA|nr:hypothetical protein FLAG1_10119 [Fusarium langsethiae]GKU09352.1 unnamed protein product [Fusarium langsethiae]GKU16202.1 unnamed protein product [Fusarium langsethiae]
MAQNYKRIDESRLLSDKLRNPDCRYISIIHPGYFQSGSDPESDVLISFEPFDDGGTGIHYDTAHTACAILAGNLWYGYFSTDIHGKIRANPSDGILRDERYYFCLPTSDDPATDKYPIVPRFRDWRFPHRNLPPIWKRYQEYLAQQDSIAIKGDRCAVTNCGDVVEEAHILPSQQEPWFSMNMMKRYARTPIFSMSQIDAPANKLSLRCDIHKIFDERHFTFVPKTAIRRSASIPQNNQTAHSQDHGVSYSNQDTLGGSLSNPHSDIPIRPREPEQRPVQLVGHVFNSTPSNDLPSRFHNREVHELPSTISVEYLFARFAYTIFSPSVFKDFLDSHKGRVLMIWDPTEEHYDTQHVSAERCRGIWNASRSRSESPRKRSRAGGDAADHEDGGLGCGVSDVDSGYGDHSQLSGGEDDVKRRGRTRGRAWEEDIDDTSGLVSDSPGAKRTRFVEANNTLVD